MEGLLPIAPAAPRHASDDCPRQCNRLWNDSLKWLESRTAIVTVASMLVSVIIATRLQPRPDAGAEAIWLDRALRSVRRQILSTTVQLEIVVGLDPGACLPERMAGLIAATAPRKRQAAALNAAVAASSGELLAFLEDDDYWEPKRLLYGLQNIEKYDLITSNQREVDPDGSFLGINDYPTPSGWLLRRTAWKLVGPFDEDFTFVDSEWLGRANNAKLRRLHLIEANASDRKRLGLVARTSHIGCTAERDPLVIRTENAIGVVGTARQDEAARKRHEDDVGRLQELYGGTPW
jgi:hypothetical protein